MLDAAARRQRAQRNIPAGAASNRRHRTSTRTAAAGATSEVASCGCRARSGRTGRPASPTLLRPQKGEMAEGGGCLAMLICYRQSRRNLIRRIETTSQARRWSKAARLTDQERLWRWGRGSRSTATYNGYTGRERNRYAMCTLGECQPVCGMP